MGFQKRLELRLRVPGSEVWRRSQAAESRPGAVGVLRQYVSETLFIEPPGSGGFHKGVVCLQRGIVGVQARDKHCMSAFVPKDRRVERGVKLRDPAETVVNCGFAHAALQPEVSDESDDSAHLPNGYEIPAPGFVAAEREEKRAVLCFTREQKLERDRQRKSERHVALQKVPKREER